MTSKIPKLPKKKSSGIPVVQTFSSGLSKGLEDNRSETVAQRQLQTVVDNSKQVQAATQYQAMADNYSIGTAQRGGASGYNGKTLQGKSATIQKKEPSKSLSEAGASMVVQRALAVPVVDEGYKDTIKSYMEKDNPAMRDSAAYDRVSDKAKELKDTDLIEMYNKAIIYIEGSERGKQILDIIKAAEGMYKVVVGKNDKNCFDKDTKTIYWNPLSFIAFWTSTGKIGVASPASVLLHEMGHAVQSITNPLGYDRGSITASGSRQKDRVIRDYNFEKPGDATTSWLIEHHNLTHNEIPFNKEKKEPLRDKYQHAYAENDYEAGSLPVEKESEIRALFSGRVKQIDEEGWGNSVVAHTEIIGAESDHSELTPAKYPEDLTIKLEGDKELESSLGKYVAECESSMADYVGDPSPDLKSRIRGKVSSFKQTIEGLLDEGKKEVVEIFKGRILEIVKTVTYDGRDTFPFKQFKAKLD